ncbi:hypothetical protein OKW41_001222 [Paraburkholderia sp. UCT70]|uniref:DUF1329 domain-containing protein n=1 Tax=Paraburkholderia sp. UCT70 TaxID=2991068 RepID=UPI003D23FF07
MPGGTHHQQNAKLEQNGLFVSGGFGGKPFPVPKDGQEALWDWELRYVGTAQRNNVKTWLVDSSGTPIVAAQFRSSLYCWPRHKEGRSTCAVPAMAWRTRKFS